MLEGKVNNTLARLIDSEKVFDITALDVGNIFINLDVGNIFNVTVRQTANEPEFGYVGKVKIISMEVDDMKPKQVKLTVKVI